MAAGNSRHISPVTHTPAPAAAVPPAIIAAGTARRNGWLMAAGIALVTWLCLSSCLGNTISCWDDGGYLRDNIYIRDLSLQGIGHIFSSFVMGNYHPLTILSYAIEYSIVGLDPWLYHADNLVLHVLVTVLVFWFVLLLSRQPVAAVVAALLFGLHPMHVESVAWASGRKDLLCALFYMAACICYLFIRSSPGRRAGLWVVLVLLFSCALLSKGIAVTLPLALLLIDYFEAGSISRHALRRQLPLFVLSVTFGIITIQAQHAAGAMAMQKVVYTIAERMALGCYALVTYTCKAVLPVQLHCLYPYPPKAPGSSLPGYYYLYPAICIALAAAAWRFARHSRVLVFGLLFFLIHIALLLQFVQVGESLVAERYSYLPYIGLFFIAGWGVQLLWQRGGTVRYATLGVSVCSIAILAAQSYERCTVWYSEVTLWKDEVSKEPVQAPQAYNNLGYYYSQQWSAAAGEEKAMYYDSAMYYSGKALAVKPDFVNPYAAMGQLQRNAGRMEEAKATFRKAMSLHPRDANLALDMAVCYYIEGKKDSAGIYFLRELTFDSSSPAHGNMGSYYEWTGNNDAALVEFNKAIALSQTNVVLYVNRAKLLKKLNLLTRAAADIDMALRMSPESGELYYLRSFCDTQQHNFPKALADADKAISLGYTPIDTPYYQSLKK